jgi:hypothetical protein
MKSTTAIAIVPFAVVFCVSAWSTLLAQGLHSIYFNCSAYDGARHYIAAECR